VRACALEPRIRLLGQEGARPPVETTPGPQYQSDDDILAVSAKTGALTPKIAHMSSEWVFGNAGGVGRVC
jgi:hypothetical protein